MSSQALIRRPQASLPCHSTTTAESRKAAATRRADRAANISAACRTIYTDILASCTAVAGTFGLKVPQVQLLVTQLATEMRRRPNSNPYNGFVRVKLAEKNHGKHSPL